MNLFGGKYIDFYSFPTLRFHLLWKPFFKITGIRLSCSINNIAADVLATQGARASTVMVLTCVPRNILVSAPEVLILLCF